MSTIIAYDRGLPDELDVFVAARAGAVRIWLASATGDLTVPELGQIGPVRVVAIRSGTIAAVIRFVRAGATASPNTKWFMPASWKSAAGGSGSPIDEIIDRVWPAQ